MLQTEHNAMERIRDFCSPADIENRLKSPLTDTVVLMLATGRFHADPWLCVKKFSISNRA